MFLFVDESGAGGRNLMFTVLRFTRWKTRVQLKRLVRHERKRFQAYLRREGRLKPPEGKLKAGTLEFLCGADKKKGRVPGLGTYPEQCIKFFERLSRVFDEGNRCQLCVISWRWDPAQQLPKRPERYMSEARRYTSLLGDILSSIRPFPPLSDPDKAFRYPKDEKRKEAAGQDTTNKLAVLVLDRKQEIIYEIAPRSLARLAAAGVPDDVLQKLASLKRRKVVGERRFLDELAATIGEAHADRYASLILRQAVRRDLRLPYREAIDQRCRAVLERKRKLRGAELQIWHNSEERDECLQLVDVLSHFFYQSQKLGIGVQKARGQPATFSAIPPVGDKKDKLYWNEADWMRAFRLLESSIDCWKATAWLFRPTERLHTPGRRRLRKKRPSPNVRPR